MFDLFSLSFSPFFILFSESGEMCAMKEVTLFSDDAKSKESAQQLGQVILFLLGFLVLLLLFIRDFFGNFVALITEIMFSLMFI